MPSYKNEAPPADDSYVSRSGSKNEPIGVVSDNQRIEDPINGATADSDEQLGKHNFNPSSPGFSISDLSSHRFYIRRQDCGMTANPVWHLVRDDTEAIDESNIVSGRTRGATQPKGTYTEPGDEEGLPSDDGTSSTNA
jgi:hypothetical protein